MEWIKILCILQSDSVMEYFFFNVLFLFNELSKNSMLTRVEVANVHLPCFVLSLSNLSSKNLRKTQIAKNDLQIQ